MKALQMLRSSNELSPQKFGSLYETEVRTNQSGNHRMEIDEGEDGIQYTSNNVELKSLLVT